MIQIHYEDKNGNKGVINYLTSDNVEVSNPKQEKLFGKAVQVDYEARKAALIEKATLMAGQWSRVFEDDKFTVVEV